MTSSVYSLTPTDWAEAPDFCLYFRDKTEVREASVLGLCLAALNKLHCDLKAKYSPVPSQPADSGPSVAPCPTCDHTEPSLSTVVLRVGQS